VFGQDIAIESDSKFGEHIRFGHLYWFLKWVLVKHLSNGMGLGKIMQKQLQGIFKNQNL
jgi:NOL1/NOP2/fmu family ribosome biogenesis protein